MTNMIARTAAMVTKLAARALRNHEPDEYRRGNGATVASPKHESIDEQPPLDFDHLAGLTSNSRPNERKLLCLFREQATRDLELLRQAKTAKDWQRAAHSMKGSAAAIGAWAIAQTATTAMQLEAHASDLEAAVLLREVTAQLAAQLAQVNHIIALRLNENAAVPGESTEARPPMHFSRSPTEAG